MRVRPSRTMARSRASNRMPPASSYTNRHGLIVVARIDVSRRASAQAQIQVPLFRRGAKQAREARDERQPSRTIGREVDGEDLRRVAREDFARERGVAHLVSQRRDACREIEFTTIVAPDVAVLEDKRQIAERLIGLRERSHHLPGQTIRRDIIGGKDRLSDLRQHRARLRVIPVLGTSGPQRVVVQLQPFLGDTAEDHRAQAPVANGQGFDPALCGPPIPERRRERRGYGCLTGVSRDCRRRQRGHAGHREDPLDEGAP